MNPATGSVAPMRVMFDASALTPRYAQEAGHERVQDLCARATELLVTSHCKAELAAALARRHHEGVLSAVDYQRVKARLAPVSAGVTTADHDDVKFLRIPHHACPFNSSRRHSVGTPISRARRAWRRSAVTNKSARATRADAT